MDLREKRPVFTKTWNFGQALLNKSIAMAAPLVTVNWKLFQMIPYVVLLEVKMFH